MIAWGPDRVLPGRRSDQVWAAWDVLPTLSELAGVVPPADLDGVSVAPVLLEETPLDDRPPLYWEHYLRRQETFRQAVRDGRWKLLRFTPREGTPRVELYDLSRDPGEAHDLAAEHPEVVARIKELMDAERTPPALHDFRQLEEIRGLTAP